MTAVPLAAVLAARCPGLAFAVEDDTHLALLQQVYADGRAEELAVVPWTPEQKRAFLDSQSALQRHHYRTHYAGAEFLVIVEGGEPVGRLCLHVGDGALNLMDIGLLAGRRGRGVGTRILEALLAIARDRGWRMTLHVEAHNRAHDWYLRHGFVLLEDRGIYRFLGWTPS